MTKPDPASIIATMIWNAHQDEKRIRAYETAAYYADLYLLGRISFECAQAAWRRIDARLAWERTRGLLYWRLPGKTAHLSD